MSQTHQHVCVHAAFYNVGMQTAQLDSSTQRHEVHMRRLEKDLADIVRSVSDLVALHLCEFGGHGDVVPGHVQQRVARVVGHSWALVWQNNYVLLWKPSRVRMVEQPVLQEVPTEVRTHKDLSNPHTFQTYTCEVQAPHGVSAPLKVIHVHHRSSQAHKWTSGSQGRGLVWLRELTKRSSAWLIGGDLNTPSYLVGPRLEEATCVFDSGRKPMDLALGLTPAPVTCEVGKHFGFTDSISDAHNVVAVELHVPTVSPCTKAPPPPKRAPPKGPLAATVSAASRPAMGPPPPPPPAPDTPSAKLPPDGSVDPPPPASAVPSAKPPPAIGLTMTSRSTAMPPPATPLAQSVPQPRPGLDDTVHVTTPPPSRQSSHVDTPAPSTASSRVETPPPSSAMSTPEPSPVMTHPKIGEPSSAASRRTDSGGETAHVDARQEQPLAMPVPMNTLVYPPGLCDAFEPSMDISQPVPDAIQQRNFDLTQLRPAPLQHQDRFHQAPAQETMQQHVDPQPVGEMPEGSAASRPMGSLDGTEHDGTEPVGSAASRPMGSLDGTEHDGTEPVDHKDPEVVQHFRTYFGVSMTSQQVMDLFEKGTAPPIFVQTVKVMAFDRHMYSYEEFRSFYGTVAGAQEWDFAKRVLQDLLLALHHVHRITNFLRLYAEVHPQVEAMRDAVFKLLLDPTKPCQQTDEPRMIVLMRMLLRPLWVRRQRLEQEHGALARFPQVLAAKVLGEVFNEWQHAWYQSNEVTMRDPNKRRSAWFAHLKQRCGGTVWAKLLIQYGPDHISDLLAVVLDVRADRGEVQAPIMPVARAAMHQRGAI